MGFKRPFVDEDFPEVPHKHLRQLEYSHVVNPFIELVPCNNCPQEPTFSGEDDGFCKFLSHEALEIDPATEVSNLIDNDLETNDPLSRVSSSSSEEDEVSGASAYSSLSPQYLELDLPRRRFVPFVDIYSSFWDHSPRKQVPVGPNHQATIPLWGKHVYKNKLDLTEKFNTNIDDSGSEEKLMGTCVIPMPDSNLSMDKGDCAGDSWADCSCLDSGSVRCVRQHVMEAREKLRKTYGDEKFVNLGFSDMGEEVAYDWTEEEEQTFHEVVYSNPVFSGKNFWKQLSLVFPSRSKSELVSYYFNVFMLRRRAAQNRSNLLDIDSDDDEWQGGSRSSYKVGDSDEDEDSVVEPLVDQDNQVDSFEDDDASNDDDDDDDDDCDNDGDDDYSSDGIEQPGREGVPKDGGIDLTSDTPVLNSRDDSKFDHLVQRVGKTPWTDREDLSAQDDSCSSFDSQASMASSCGPVNTGTEHGKADWCHDAVGQFYFMESYDAKCSSASLKGFDLLSTWNMIEEVFGEGTPDNKMRDD